jgi:MoxR-like ATPase
MNLINSKNRTPAKRLLNSFYDSKQVRVWSLAQLNDALQRAINGGLITQQGAERVLGMQSKGSNFGCEAGHNRGKNNEAERDDADDNYGESDGGDGSTEDGSEGGSEGSDDAEGGDDDSSQGGGSHNDYSDDMEMSDDAEFGDDSGNGAESDEEGDSDGGGESDSDDGDDSDSESDSESDEEGDSDSDEDDEQDDDSESDSESEQEQEQEQQDEQEQDEDEDDSNDPLRHEMFETVLKWIRSGVNVALVGAAGTGKSTIVQHVCEELHKEFRGTGALMSKYDLVGYKDANGEYHATPLYEAFAEGHVFCFDELDASAPDAVVAFNAATDNQNIFSFPCGMVQKHAGFVAVCCMNTWGNGATSDYVGRFKQDAAAMSRFVKVHIGYDRNVEARIAGRNNLDIAQRVWDLRDACEALAIRHVVSTRMIVQAVAGRAARCTKAEIDRDVLFAGLDEGAIRQVKSKMRELANQRNAQ